MPRLHAIQYNFSAGELSPLLMGRLDLAKYANGCTTLENMTVFPQGGTTRRGGLRFVAATKFPDKKARLINFEFSVEQAYVLEFGDQYIRFFKDGGQITLTAVSISGATQANPVVVTAVGHALTAGDRVVITGVGGMVELNNREFTVANPAGNTFELSGVNGLAYGAYTSGGSVAEIYEIASPYLEANLAALKGVQSADTMFLVHRSYAPRKLSRTGHTNWTLSEIDFVGGPFRTEAATPTITPSATTGTVTLTASAALWNAGHVGALWRIKHGTTWGYVKITAFTDTTHVTALVKDTLGAITASDFQAEGAWSTYRGWPGAVTFFEERLLFAGSTANPQTIWGSESGDYYGMRAGIDNDDAFAYTIGANQVNLIRWLVPSRTLVVGTVAQEFTAGGGSDEPITPTNIQIKAQTAFGTADIMPVAVRNATLFVQRMGRKLRELGYKWEEDSYDAADLTILAEHVTEGGMLEATYQQEPDSTVWAVRGDGVLLGMTYEPRHEVIAWHRHITDGQVESVAVIPNTTVTANQLWVLVKRTVGGVTKRFIEYLDPALNSDSALTYSGAAVSTVTGLTHLIGKTVKVKGDGAVYPDAVVSAAGTVALSSAASEVEVGLDYVSTLLTLRPEIPVAGTSQASKKRWARVFVRLHESLGVTINGDQLPFRTPTDPMDAEPALFSGDKRVSNLGWDRDGRIEIKQTQPLPLTVLAVFGDLEVGE